jgi:hypothetical protein
MRQGTTLGDGEKRTGQRPRRAPERVSHACWLEQLAYTLYGNLADSLALRFRSSETVSRLHLALTGTFIKYAFTGLPEVPSSLMAGDQGAGGQNP